MFKNGHEYYKYCKCTGNGNTSETMCEFCKNYSKLRYYQSMFTRGKIEPGSGMSDTLLKLKSWYYSIFKTEFQSPGKGKKHNTDNRSKGISIHEIKSEISKIQLETASTNVKPDTFEFNNNRIIIKDSRDVKCIIIDLNSRQITTLGSHKYTIDGASAEIINNLSFKIQKIKKILEG